MDRTIGIIGEKGFFLLLLISNLSLTFSKLFARPMDFPFEVTETLRRLEEESERQPLMELGSELDDATVEAINYNIITLPTCMGIVACSCFSIAGIGLIWYLEAQKQGSLE